MRVGETTSSEVDEVTATSVTQEKLSWIKNVFRIALREFRILMRSHWGIGLLAFFAVFSVSVVGFGTTGVGPGSYPSVVVSLLELAVYLIPLAALTAGYDTVVGDYEAGTLDMLFALPVSRTQVLIGKYLGRMAVLAGALIVGLSVGGGVVVWIVGFSGLALYSLFILVSVITAAVFLGISVLLSTLSKQKIRALAYAQITWLWFVLLHDLLALGVIAEFNLPDKALEAMVLLNPTDLYRLAILGQLKTRAGGFSALLTQTGLTEVTVSTFLLVWLLLPVGLATWLINSRR